MISNPFTSDIFTLNWQKHFTPRQQPIAVTYFPDLKFCRHPRLPILFNIGKTNTKGITYSIPQLPTNSKSSEVYVIYDVHSYHQKAPSTYPGGLGYYRIPQYAGYTVKLEDYQNIEEYFKEVFGSKSRNTLQRKKKKLEEGFPVRYTTYYGAIDKVIYDELFEDFRKLLEKRFDDKQEENNNLNPKEWQFFKDVTHPMILSKQACLLVCYNDSRPIGIMLNFLSPDVLFQAITVFDIDYYKYNVGTVNILKLISWCIDNKLKYLDFSKGHYEYKTHWGTFRYPYEYHIWYNKKNLYSRFLAWQIAGYYRAKQQLRNLKLNELKRKLDYFIRKFSFKQ